MFSVSSRSSASLRPTSPAQRLRHSYSRGITPPPRISVPDWADKFRKLAREAGSTSGAWSTSTVEIARGPLLARTEPGVHVITAMVATQLLKTSVLENFVGYHAHLDPCPMLLVQPKEAAAEQFSKERIGPLIKATPVLRELIGSAKTRTKDETILYKAFPGGFLAMAGAGSPDNLARRPVRLVLYDEVDKYPITREGDPISLGDERMATFVNWLSVRVCSPTVDGESRIQASFLEGDQRFASVACPHCDHRQFPEFFKHVDWAKPDGEHQPKTAALHCEACGVAWSEGERLRSLRTIRWHQTRPFTCCGERHVPLEAYGRAWREDEATAVDLVWEWWAADRYAVYRAKCPHCATWAVDNEHASFQAGKLFSPWPKDTPARQAAKWLAAKENEDLKQVWWNTQQGLPYRAHSGRDISIEALAGRGEVWPAEIPDGVAVLTAGVDVQDYRLEVELVGWGRNEESWSVDHEVFEGDPGGPEIWDRLDAYLKKIRRRADGRGFEVMAACIDSGGHHTEQVYQFAKARLQRRVWAIKGESARNGQRSPVWPTKIPSSRTKKTFRPVILGVNSAKDAIRNRLHIEGPGAGYMHFPADRDIGWFAQLISERSIVKEASGQKFRIWELPAGKANEALDCRVYAYAALCGLLHFGLKLNRRADSTALAPIGGDQGSAAAAPADADPDRTGPEPSPPAPPSGRKSIARRLA